MVTLLLDSTQLEVGLSPVERALSRRKDPVWVERSLIRRVQLTDDAWNWLRGVPNPGTLVRGAIAMGTWRSAGSVDFVVVRRRHPAVVIDLDDRAEFQRIVLTTRHGVALAQALRLEADGEPVPVADLVAAADPDAAPAPPRRARPPRPATARTLS